MFTCMYRNIKKPDVCMYVFIPVHVAGLNGLPTTLSTGPPTDA